VSLPALDFVLESVRHALAAGCGLRMNSGHRTAGPTAQDLSAAVSRDRRAGATAVDSALYSFRRMTNPPVGFSSVSIGVAESARA